MGVVTRDDSKQRFLAQHSVSSVAMLKQCCNYSKQCRNNVATRCCAKNRRCQSSRVTSPLNVVAVQKEGQKPVAESDVMLLHRMIRNDDF